MAAIQKKNEGLGGGERGLLCCSRKSLWHVSGGRVKLRSLD
jgi:hypothetical protein